MNLEIWFEEVVLHEKPGLGPAFVRLLLKGVSYVYGGVIEAYKAMFRFGILREVCLPCRVVSVGNITMGGVGKTVATIALARSLQSQGIRCVILSYGFHSASRDLVTLVSDESRVLISAAEAGDEAFLLATSLPGCPVIIGKRRALAGWVAMDHFHPDVIILDDGFQHWRLHRDVDIVLLDAREPMGRGRVFPYGQLREFPHSLCRSSVCLLTRCDFATAEERQEAHRILHRIVPNVPVFETTHQPGTWYIAAPGEERSLWLVDDRPVLVISGIGQNKSFQQMVEKSGAQVTACLEYPDHHLYSPADIQTILTRSAGCAAVVTTEKDAVKLSCLWPSNALPLVAAPVELAGISTDQWVKIAMPPEGAATERS